MSCKVVLLGSQGVGKTAIVTSFLNKKFSNSNLSTVAASYSNAIIDVSGTDVKVQIWDTAGQEKYRSLAPMYYHDADAAIVVFSVTDRQSFENVPSWIEELNEQIDSCPAIYIVGNKCDMDDREVLLATGQALATESNAKEYFETSAKSGQNINELFWMVASDYLARKSEDSHQVSQSILESDTENYKKNCC